MINTKNLGLQALVGKEVMFEGDPVILKGLDWDTNSALINSEGAEWFVGMDELMRIDYHEFVYQLVSSKGARYINADELTKEFDIYRLNYSYYTKPELQLQFNVPGYVGPMYNGKHEGKTCIRYETSQAYEMYSR